VAKVHSENGYACKVQKSFLVQLHVLWEILSVFTTLSDLSTNSIKGKGKAIPVLASTGPEGSRRLRLPDFKTIGT
jgi:hypothetical protein